MSWALAILGVGKSALSWLLGVAKRHPWQFALIAALALAGWQSREKNGALAERDAARTSLTAAKAELASARTDWAKQVAAAKAATASAEHKSQEIAQDAQTTHDALLADNAGLRDYIAAHRVRQPSGAVASGTAQDSGAPFPDDPAALPLVAMPEDDVRSCDALYRYARPAYEWAQGLIAKGLAVQNSGDGQPR
ncbi:hypothetical protein EDF56_101128 [Novosphingobium sp. PhB165]|uniref:hypothetical protein n=1 Tax=Novosphingobium sp. PhB165 TaxID=2485105 RepID=UPI00104D38CE|nr:hypothetical protein [Novosphingobium sp. PhB165]TCM21464.1 hypothetical protein EDF56_101128 [Novosphingobium sp. PhB165]